jgi:hypothetical protein
MNNHHQTKLTIRELKNALVIKNHKEEQSGIFNNTTFEKARQIIENDVVFTNLPYGYKDDNGKIVLIGYPSVFNHMLALYFPEEMGVDVERTETTLFGDKKAAIKDLTGTFNNIMLLKQDIEKSGATKEELDQFNEIISRYNDYGITFVLYTTKEQAFLANTLI